MKIIKVKYILRCDENFEIIEDGAVVYNEKIIDYGESDFIIKKYPDLEVCDYENSILMPSLINPHLHLEFSANKTTLTYGDFIEWLKSVITYREELIESCHEKCMDEAIKSCKISGVGAIGAVSSYGFDLQSCVNSNIKVVYFNEILGSRSDMLDALLNDFNDRVYTSLQYKSKLFTPAVAIHSPYSTHPLLAKRAIESAKFQNMVVSTHFMESVAERKWLDEGLGDFQDFFKLFLPNSKPLTSALDYLALFKEVKTLFTHCVYANQAEISQMKKMGCITHCPTSNRLLGAKKLDIKDLENLTIGTDGLSSNNSLNLWDELRTALMIHNEFEVNDLAKKLLKSVTLNGAKALNLNSGQIAKGKYADMILVQGLGEIEDIDTIATSLILHTKKVEKLFVNGETICI